MNDDEFAWGIWGPIFLLQGAGVFALLSDALPLESLRAVFPYWFGTWFWQNCGLVSYVISAGPWKLSLPSDETCEFIDNQIIIDIPSWCHIFVRYFIQEVLSMAWNLCTPDPGQKHVVYWWNLDCNNDFIDFVHRPMRSKVTRDFPPCLRCRLYHISSAISKFLICNLP